MNILALRFVVIELLRGHMDTMFKYDDLTKFLDDVSAKSHLAEHWVCNLIKSVLVIMLYVRAEREGEFALHHDVCKKMLPYFFAACHWNYARDGVVYVQMMENLPGYVLNPLMKREHIVRLHEVLWNSISTDMAIESTCMKIGKGPSGLIGVTTQERTVKVWANGHHLCSNLLSELDNLRSSDSKDRTKHNEEGYGRIKADQIDRKKLQDNLEKCIHPLQVDTHKNWNTLVNIYTGEEVGEDVNVNKAVEIGQKQMKEFCSSLPQGFRERLSTKVKSMAESKKTKQISVVAPFNTELISSRVLYLLGNSQPDFTTLFNYELSPVPTSMFYDSGEARYPKSKVVLKNRLKVEVSVRGVEVDAAEVDGRCMLHSSIHWPKDGSVKDLAKGVEKYVSRLLHHSDVYVIFDRYFDKSIKSDTRLQRIEN